MQGPTPGHAKGLSTGRLITRALCAIVACAVAGLAQAQLPGDADCDGQVTADDLLALSAALHAPPPSCAGADANRDGVLSAADLTATLVALRPLGPEITFLGVAGSDGRASTALGNLPDGTPVYFRSSGFGFLLVVEAAPGPSGGRVGTRVFDSSSTDPSRQPDLQIQVDRPLGAGSRAVCDERGVPAVVPADFSAIQTVSNALNDLGCRFSVSTTRAATCTLDQFSQANFLSPRSTTQFCLQVNSDLAFSNEETTVIVRLRDQTGAMGPVRRLKLRVANAPFPPTFTPVPPSVTRTATTTRTPSNSPSSTRTATETRSATPTRTASATAPSTATRTATATRSSSPTRTSSPPATPSRTATLTATATQTGTPAATATGPTATRTRTGTITRTPTRTPTSPPGATSTSTRTVTRTATRTSTATRTATRPPTGTATRTRTSTLVPTPTRTATTGPSATSTRTPSRTPTWTPTPDQASGPIIVFLGLLRPDDTLIQPDGVDPSGRPIFERPFGFGFQIVVEARPGSSGRPVALTTFNDFGRPDLQIQSNRSLGNGSPAVCDVLPPDPGGVPGIDPPSFAEGEIITDRLNDLSCRFIDGVGNQRGRNCSNGCVRFESGESGCVGGGTTAQYCALVDRNFEFPAGETLITARVRDTQGNLGPPAQLIVRVPQ